MSNCKLFVCCHQNNSFPKNELLVPVQVGAALAGEHFDGFVYDDAGENISRKNRSYCELTAHYWAWKNADADYFGFFHYRRFLYPARSEKRPYRIEPEPTADLLKKLGYSDFSALIGQYDLIAPIGENMYIPIREHYASAPHHYGKDLETVEQIVREKHPDMIPAMDSYLSGTVAYFGNIYIMSRAVFYDYCGWLFPILEEFDRRTDISSYSVQEKRVNGYLAERLFGIYLTHVRGTLRVLELPRVHFEKKASARIKQKLIAALLPPGSRQRAWVKAKAKGMN